LKEEVTAILLLFEMEDNTFRLVYLFRALEISGDLMFPKHRHYTSWLCHWCKKSHFH